jgi:hypothetical protein
MYCGGGHLGFPIGIKKIKFVKGLPCPGMMIGRSSTSCVFFYADRKSKLATTTGHRLTLDPMGKCSNAFSSEISNIIKAKLYMNVHWMVLYKLYVFCSDMRFETFSP